MLSDRLIELDRNLSELESNYPNFTTSFEIRSEWANRLKATKREVKQRANDGESTGDEIKDRCMTLGVYYPARYQALKRFIQEINQTSEPLAYVGNVYSGDHREPLVGYAGRLVVLDSQTPRVVTNPNDERYFSDSHYLYLNILGDQVPLHIPTFMISRNFPNPFADNSIIDKEYQQVLDAQETEKFIEFGVEEQDLRFTYFQGNGKTYDNPVILFGEKVRKSGVWKEIPLSHTFGSEALIRFGEYLQENGLSIRTFDLPADLRRRVLFESADAVVSLVKSAGALLTEGKRANKVKASIYDSMTPESQSSLSIEPPTHIDYEYDIIAYRMIEAELAKAKGEYNYAQRRVAALEVQPTQILQAVQLAPGISVPNS